MTVLYNDLPPPPHLPPTPQTPRYIYNEHFWLGITTYHAQAKGLSYSERHFTFLDFLTEEFYSRLYSGNTGG